MAVVYLQRCLLCRRRAVNRWGDWYVCRDHYDALVTLRTARERVESAGAHRGLSGPNMPNNGDRKRTVTDTAETTQTQAWRGKAASNKTC